MTVPVAVRRAARRDLAAIMSIEAASFGRPWREDAFASLLDRSGADVLVAVLGGKVAGYAVLVARAGDAELANLAVHPGRRGRGIAPALLRECVAAARRRGERRILLAVRASNDAAVGVYAAFGFREIGLHPGYYRDPEEDAVIFALEVGRRRPGGSVPDPAVRG